MTEDKRLKQLRELGLTISYYRKLKGLTQGQLASLVGLSRTHISNIEAPNGKTSISLNKLFDIAEVLEVPMKVKRGTYVSYNGETHTSEIDDISGGIGFAGSPIAVLIDYEWGYIDSKGRMMIPCQYTSAGTFFDRNVLEE